MNSKVMNDGVGRRWRWRYQWRCDSIEHNCLCCSVCLGSGLVWQLLAGGRWWWIWNWFCVRWWNCYRVTV